MTEPTNKMIRKFKKVEKTFWDMTPQEQYDYVTGVLEGFSPNEEVRNRKK
jgi:dynactin complex subunit